MPKGRRPGGVTPHLRSGAAARVPDCDGAGMAARRYPASEVRGRDKRSYPASEVRGGGGEEIPQAPSPRPGAVGRRSYPMPLSLRPRAVAGRSNTRSKEPWLRRRRRA